MTPRSARPATILYGGRLDGCVGRACHHAAAVDVGRDRRVEILSGGNGDNYVALGNDAMNLVALSYYQGSYPLGYHALGQLTHCGVVAHPDQGVRNKHPHLIRSTTYS